MNSKGFVTLTFLLVIGILSSLCISTSLLLKEMRFLLSSQKHQLSTYSDSLSGLRYSPLIFDDLTQSSISSPNFDDIRNGRFVSEQRLSFYLFKNETEIYSLAESNGYITALRCRYHWQDDTLVLDNLDFYSED